jgi:hypothetical protein
MGMAIPINKRKKYKKLLGSVDGINGGSVELKNLSGAKKIAKTSQPITDMNKVVMDIFFNILDFISFTPYGGGTALEVQLPYSSSKRDPKKKDRYSKINPWDTPRDAFRRDPCKIEASNVLEWPDIPQKQINDLK